MPDLIRALDFLRSGVRVLALAAFALTALAMVAEWLVRSRKVNPFGALARFVRRWVDPRLRPIEARLVRSGASPANAPWLLLLVVTVAALLLILVADTLVQMAVQATFAGSAGPRAVVIVGLSWAFAALRLALMVRVVGSWLQQGRYSRWTGWSYRLTDWMIVPLQRVIPSLGMIDLTPLVAYFGLVIVERIILGLLAP